MNVDPAARITEPVTVCHRATDADSWTVATYPLCDWQERRSRTASSDGSLGDWEAVTVQIPEDQHPRDLACGDWVVRGVWVPTLTDGVLTTSALLSQRPAASARVRSVKDLTGGLSGLCGPITRYASTWVLECE